MRAEIDPERDHRVEAVIGSILEVEIAGEQVAVIGVVLQRSEGF